MNKAELEYMLSLADEKYIDEIFTDRIRNKSKKIFAGIGAVAAVLALICGIGFAVSRTDSSDDLVVDTTPDSILIDEPVDYSIYFQNKFEAYDASGLAIAGGGIYCRFDDEYTRNILPVDTSDFGDAYSELFFDYKDEVNYITMEFLQRDEIGAMEKVCYIYAGRKGNILSRVKFNDAVSRDRFDTEIYGREYLENNNRFLELLFTNGDMDYSIVGINMSYDEMGAIMDAALRGSISEEKFDLSKASEIEYSDVGAYISLAEANTIKPFAGCVPQLDSIGDMQLEGDVSYIAKRNEARELVPDRLLYRYSFENGDETKELSIQYYTKESDVAPYENTVHINNYTSGIFSSFEENGVILCTIECDNFDINVGSINCTEEDILTFKAALADAISELESPTRTLAEANEIEPFAGYVPQLDSVGSIPFDTCWYNNYLNGSKQLVILYSADNISSSGNIQAVFESGGKPSVTLKNYVRLEDIKINIVHDLADISPVEGQNTYSMTVDCGKFMIDINAVCSSDEMWTYLSEIAKAYDGSEISYMGEHPVENKTVTLEYANEATAFSGFVPQLNSVGELFVRDVTYDELFVDNKPVDSTLHIEYSPNTSYSSQYIITEYQQDLNVSDEGTIKIEDLTEDSAEQVASFAVDPNDNFYNLAVKCGEFYIYIVAECPEETMREYLRALKETCPKYTALTLEEASASELTSGYVPLLDKIGDMTLEDGYCRIEEQPDGVQLLKIKYRNNDFKYQNERYDYYGKYISVTYAKRDGSISWNTDLNGIEIHPEAAMYLDDSGVGKGTEKFYCGDVYIEVEFLCSAVEELEYLSALKESTRKAQ